MKKTILSLLIMSTSLGALAVGVTQEGTPSDTSTTKAYGINVSAKTGLKTLVPSDFKLYIHKEVKLPEFVSWNIGKYWVDELTKIAYQNNLNIYINWDKKEVFVTTEKIIEENKESAVIAAQAATTPIPKLKKALAPIKEEVTQPQTPLASTAIQAQPQATDTSKVSTLQKESARAPEIPKTITKEEVKQSIKVPSWDDFKYNAPTAFSRLSARTTAQILANTFKYRLVFDLPDFKMPGPVTLFGGSVEEDIDLLNKALGTYHPVYATVQNNKIILKLKPNRTLSIKDLIPAKLELPYSDSESSKNIEAEPLIEAAPSTKILDKDSLDKGETLETSNVELSLAKGTTLESSLYALSKEKGYLLEWKVAGGFEATKSVRYAAKDLEQLLKDILPKVGLSYQLKNKTITITPGASDL